MPLPRISVITPSLNQGAYLERTIRSVLDQGYPELEYIVVDGGSQDQSVSILERYSEQITRWVSEEDDGQANAINKGFSWATGDVVAYINSDDYYLPGALDRAGTAMRDPTVRWCVGHCRYEHADGALERLFVPTRPSMPRWTMIRETWYVPQASSFWRRDVIDELGGLRDDLHYVFDLEFGLRCALNGITPLPIEHETAVRYLHGEAKSASPASFTNEFIAVQRELEEEWIGAGDRIHDVAFRARRRLARNLGKVL